MMNKFMTFIKPFETIISPLSAFFCGTLLTCVAFALLTSELSLLMNKFGISTSVVGIILAMYYVGYIFASLTSFKIINKVGHIRAFSTYISLFSALVLLHIFSHNPWFWGFLRFAEGYCLGSALLCLESWLNTRANNQNRGLIMALYMVTTYLGSGLGQLLLNIPSANGMGIFVLVSIIFSVALVPISLTALPAPQISVAKSLSFRELYKISPVGVVGCFCSGIFVGGFYTLGALYAKLAGLSLTQTSLFMFWGILGGMCAQIPVGKISDIMDRRFVLMWAAGAMFLVAPWVHFFLGYNNVILCISAFALGACTFIMYPISVSHVNDLVDDNTRVRASGLLIMLQSFGMVLGPIVISFAMQHLGNIWFLLSFSSAAGLFVLYAFKHIACRDIQYIEITPTPPQPTSPTPLYQNITQNDSLLDKAKDALASKKH